MYAIFEDSGTQVLVRKDDEIEIDLRPLKEGEKTITFDKVLAVGGKDGQPARIGVPYLSGVTVTAELLSEETGPKLRLAKYTRRKGYRRTLGHRQRTLLVKVTGIHG
ncbi:MAG: ribosomal protein [Planctomycetota bacterium]